MEVRRNKMFFKYQEEEKNMALKDTSKKLGEALTQVAKDLAKAVGGNRAASQRVRTGTIKLEKLAKVFRKESVKEAKKALPKKKASPKKKPATKKKAEPKRKVATKKKAPAKKKTAAKKKATKKRK